MPATRLIWTPVYLGIGSNLEDPAQQVRLALSRLAGLRESQLVLQSALYGNPPMGPQDQPDYVNAVAGLLTRLPPDDLLRELQALENELGRVRAAGDRWGPRVIDLDILVYGKVQQAMAGLQIPHPGISERNFVLFPLSDIAPLLMVPGQGEVRALARNVTAAGLQRIDD